MKLFRFVNCKLKRLPATYVTNLGEISSSQASQKKEREDRYIKKYFRHLEREKKALIEEWKREFDLAEQGILRDGYEDDYDSNNCFEFCYIPTCNIS